MFKTINILSIDVEDWFHILEVPSTPDYNHWDILPSRLENNFRRLMDILDESKTRATCFCLAWVAKRFPHLIREADARGHEIASHGCAHTLIYRQTRAAFLQDIREAKQILEDTAGKPVIGYRAPGFSVTEATPWFFDALAEAGYHFDSSIFPAKRGHGGMSGARREPYVQSTKFGAIREFPISIAELFGLRFCFSGGGYFRLFPYWLIAQQTRKLHQLQMPLVVYLHPREIDPQQPRMAMNRIRRFKSYTRLHTTEKKLRRLLADFHFTSFTDSIQQTPAEK